MDVLLVNGSPHANGCPFTALEEKGQRRLIQKELKHRSSRVEPNLWQVVLPTKLAPKRALLFLGLGKRLR